MSHDPDLPSLDDIVNLHKTQDFQKKPEKPSLAARCKNYIKSTYAASKKVNKGLLYMTLSGIAANTAASLIATQCGAGPEVTHAVSYWSELVVGSSVFTINYTKSAFEEGMHKKEVIDELIRIGITAFALSISLYKPARDYISLYLENHGWSTYFATPVSQLSLLAPFGAVLDVLGKPMKYVYNTGKEMTAKAYNATKDYMTGNGKKNGDSNHSI